MREAGKITGEALLVARDHIREGISTWELDTVIRNHIEKRGAKPSFLGLYGFPGSACISINDGSFTEFLPRREFCSKGIS